LIRAVLVDLGDTLVHLNRPWDEVFQHNLESLYAFFKESGTNLDFQEFARIFIREFERASATSQLYKVEVPMQDIVSKVLRKIRLRDVSGTVVQDAIEEFYRPEVDAWQLFPDAVETLTALREMGLKMGLISNSKSDWAVRAILEKYDLSKLFEVIVTSAELRMRKPRLNIFTRALVALHAKPCETVFVGDSLQADIIGARTAGLRSIHVRRKPVDHPHFVVPDVAVTSLAEALAQIIRWNSASLEKEPSAA
jgi:HAD superfamily hydrolase (TIGR01662 family)